MRLVVVEQAVPVVLGVGQEFLAEGVRLFRAAVENLKKRYLPCNYCTKHVLHSTCGSHHGCQMAKFDPFLSLDCAGLEGVGAQSKERKGSNFAA